MAKAPVGAFANSVIRNLYSLDYGIVSDVWYSIIVSSETGNYVIIYSIINIGWNWLLALFCDCHANYQHVFYKIVFLAKCILLQYTCLPH